MEVTQQLRQFGLNQSEITVYLYLLENGVSTPPIVSRRTFIARTNCYNILNELSAKGLIEEKEAGKRKAYVARDPESLVSMVEQKREIAQRMLPELRAIYTTQKNKPKMRFFEGLDEVKKVWQEAFESHTVYQVGSSKVLESRLPGYQDYLKIEAQKHSIVYKHIADIADDTLSKILAGDWDTTTTHLLIWNDSVAFITLDDPAFGTVLVNSQISNLCKLFFESLWDKL